jgi:LuxR family transcriptional regulator, quorum-sensing system regulator BjaR1
MLLGYPLEASICIDEIGRLSRPDDVAARLQAGFATFGCDYALFTGLPCRSERLEDFVILNTFPPDYYKIYTEQRLVEVCPVVRQCRRTILPFEWSEVPYDAEREPRTAEVLSIAADFGLPRGLTVPVPSPQRGERARAVGLAGPRLDLSPPAKQAMHLIALYGFERLCSLAAAADTARTRGAELGCAGQIRLGDRRDSFDRQADRRRAQPDRLPQAQCQEPDAGGGGGFGETADRAVASVPTELQHSVMPGLVPGIHDFTTAKQARRGWPGQARP